jgi:NADPH-dependent ferric siderophore reductase
MLTSTADPAHAPAPPRQAKPSYRPFQVSVAAIRQLTDTFTRVTFTGPDLHEFGTAGLDQRVKVVLPLPEVGVTPLPEDESWYEAWRNLPDEARNPIRTYTVRTVRPALREIDIDFVTHGDAGPASRWVRHAAVGDRLAVVGPDANGENPQSGIEWRPGDARTVLIAGDETAAPAICSILAALPRDARGRAFIEVPHEGDALEISAPEGVEVTWLARARGNSAHGVALEEAVRDWTTRFVTHKHRAAEPADVDIEHEILWDVPPVVKPGAELYSWLAGEAAVIKTLRRFLVSETGIDRRQVAFMGYWRDGRAELN